MAHTFLGNHANMIFAIENRKRTSQSYIRLPGASMYTLW